MHKRSLERYDFDIGGPLLMNKPIRMVDCGDVINDPRDLGMSYLFITHDLMLVENFADRVAMMYQGMIVEEGPAQDVWRNPQHAFTRSLIDAIPIPDPDVRLGSGRSAFAE